MTMSASPKWSLTACFAISAAAAILASLGLGATALELARGAREVQLWFLVVFQLVVIGAGVFGMLTGLGRFSEAPALSMLISGGSIFTLSVLAEPALVIRLTGAPGQALVIGGVSVLPFTFAGAVLGVALMLLAGASALARGRAKSRWYLARAAATGLPVALAAGLALWPPAQKAFLAMPGVVAALVAVIGFFVLGGLLSASLHCVIRAFEVAARE